MKLTPILYLIVIIQSQTNILGEVLSKGDSVEFKINANNDWNVIDSGGCIVSRKLSTGKTNIICCSSEKSYPINENESDEEIDSLLTKPEVSDSSSSQNAVKLMYDTYGCSIKSLFGNYLSYDTYISSTSEDLNYGYSEQITTIDLDDLDKVGIDYLFDTVQVLNELLKNKFILNCLDGVIPNNITELQEIISTAPVYNFNNLLGQYSFTKISKSKITIQFFVSSDSRVSAGAHQYFSIVLPIPPALKHLKLKVYGNEKDTQ